MLSSWWLLVTIPVIITRLSVRESELDTLTRELVMREAELVTETQEEGECQYVPRVRRTYQVIVIDEEGLETEDTVELLDTTWPQRQR